MPAPNLLVGADRRFNIADRRISPCGERAGVSLSALPMLHSSGTLPAPIRRHRVEFPVVWRRGPCCSTGALRLVPRRSMSRRSDRGGMTRCGLAMSNPTRVVPASGANLRDRHKAPAAEWSRAHSAASLVLWRACRSMKSNTSACL